MWVLVLQPLSAGLAISELRLRAKDLRPVLIVILAGNIVLRNLVLGHFGLVRIRSIFHAADDPSLERLPFFEQLLGALRIHVLNLQRKATSGSCFLLPIKRNSTQLKETLFFKVALLSIIVAPC